MSVIPGLLAPTLQGPYKNIPAPGEFQFPTPLSPADLARQRKNQGIDAKRRAGTQALQTIKGNVPIAGMPAPIPGRSAPLSTGLPQSVPAAIGKAPPPTGTPQAATPDAYLQSQQNLIASENNLLGLMGKPAPQYKPPNKGLEYLAAGIALLFPGAPIANAASGLLQGMQGGAEQRYQRETQAQQQEITNAEKQTGVFGTIADAQARIAAQLEATRVRQEEYAQRHADTLGALKEKHNEFQQMFPIHSALAQSQINFRLGELANQVARNTITQQDAQARLQVTQQVAALTQAGLDKRHFGDLAVRAAVAKAQSIDRQLDGQLKTLDAGVAADTTGQKAIEAQTTAANLITQAQQQVQEIIDGVAPGRSDISNLSTGTPGAPPPVPKKTISKAEAVRIGASHGRSAAQAVKDYEAAGYTVTP